MLNLKTFTGRFVKRHRLKHLLENVQQILTVITSFTGWCCLLTKHPKVLNLKSVSIFIMVTYLIGVFCI